MGVEWLIQDEPCEHTRSIWCYITV